MDFSPQFSHTGTVQLKVKIGNTGVSGKYVHIMTEYIEFLHNLKIELKHCKYVIKKTLAYTIWEKDFLCLNFGIEYYKIKPAVDGMITQFNIFLPIFL